MTTEARSGSHAIRCDCPNCHAELIRRTREQVQEEASLCGWKFDVVNDRHLCLDCQQGRCPGDAVEIRARCREMGVDPGLPLGRFYPDMADCLLVAVTEKRTKGDIDMLVGALGGII